MGIKDFYNIAIPNNKTIKDLGTLITLKNLAGMRIAIDGNLIAYQCMTAISSDKALTDGDGKITQHLLISLNKIIAMNLMGIHQLWIFDNPIPNPRKAETHKQRKEHREKYSGNRLRLSSEHYDEIKQLLEYLGIPYVIAPSGVEGEQFGAWLTYGELQDERICQYILSADADVLLFEGNVIRQYTEGVKGNKKTKLALFEYNRLISELDMSKDDLCKMAMVMGHDFGAPVRGTAKGTVYKKVKAKQFDSLFNEPEKQEELSQYYMEPSDYIDDAEYHYNESYRPEELIEWLNSRGFNKNILLKRLSKYKHIC